ncbi:transmembrane protein 150A-like isoform X1 [Polypterus senegalus]|nr:transmembrane protein 150A-like isoform X1 [Polypterus senegalus]XP_039624585.1 transmembrane protein 150A-like isoform X1 [Polypterus senegalus]
MLIKSQVVRPRGRRDGGPGINMSRWIFLPVSLTAFTITGIWLVYAMALTNKHVCPVDNWVYNQSCEQPLVMQMGSVLCCIPDNIPFISKCGTLPPESCVFSLISSTGSFMVMVIGLLRYAHVIERHRNCILNVAGLSAGWICAAGLLIVGNFQVDSSKVLHYIGAGVAFPTSMLFACLQSVLTYRLAHTQREYHIAHLRSSLTVLAFITLVLSGAFFVQESFALQHASAICEWAFTVVILVFFGTFAYEFSAVSNGTLLVLFQRASGERHHKSEAGVSSNSNSGQPENISML